MTALPLACKFAERVGVNPSLTISALALRIADKIVEELPPAVNP